MFSDFQPLKNNVGSTLFGQRLRLIYLVTSENSPYAWTELVLHFASIEKSTSAREIFAQRYQHWINERESLVSTVVWGFGALIGLPRRQV